MSLLALGFALATVAVLVTRNCQSSSAVGLSPPPLQQQLSSTRLKEESPAPPSSPKALAPQRRRSRASSDLSGFELPLPPPLPPAFSFPSTTAAAAATTNGEDEEAPTSTRATTKYLSILVNGLASPFISNNIKSLRRTTNNPDLIQEAATVCSQQHALDIPKLRFVGNEFDEVEDMV